MISIEKIRTGRRGVASSAIINGRQFYLRQLEYGADGVLIRIWTVLHPPGSSPGIVVPMEIGERCRLGSGPHLGTPRAIRETLESLSKTEPQAPPTIHPSALRARKKKSRYPVSDFDEAVAQDDDGVEWV